MAKKISGIYCITNTANGKKYYGSSVNVWGRQRQHWHTLRAGVHRNRHLQAAWNLYGEVAFVFTLVEEVPAENLVAVEQSYLDANTDGYNLSKNAECAPRGLKWSEESKRRMSEAKRGRKLSEAHKEALSEAGKGRRATDAQRAAASKRMKGKTVGTIAKEKISTALQSLWGDDAYRERMLNAQSLGKSTSKAKMNYSAAVAARWADPQQRQRLSAERKARWADPEYRAKMTEKRIVQGQKLRERNLAKKECKPCTRETGES